MSVLVTFVVRDDLLPFSGATPLEGVVIRVYDSTGVTFVTEVMTDASGTVDTLLDDATTYWVRFFKIGYAFNSRLAIDVDSSASSNSFDVAGRDLAAHPGATDPNLCRVSGYVLNVVGAPVGGITMYFMRTEKPMIMGNSIIIPSKVYIRSDSDGYVEVELVRNGAYDFWVEGFDDVTYRVKVPDYTSADITDLVWPYVASIVFDPAAVTLAVDESYTTSPTITLSNRVTMPYMLDGQETVTIGKYYVVQLSDASVATLNVNALTGVFTIVGRAAGTTTITFTPLVGSVPERQPMPPTELQTLTITVT
jgi:hypothetical protein